MYQEHYEKVAEFQDAFNQPSMLSKEVFESTRSDLRDKLEKEELTELLDALVDVAYIALGTISEVDHKDAYQVVLNNTKQYHVMRNTCRMLFGEGVFDEAFTRVHESNMSKLVDGKPLINGEDGVLDESKPLGKILKPDTYKPVNLEDLV